MRNVPQSPKYWAAAIAIVLISGLNALAQPLATKAEVSQDIRRVEDGVDKFRDYLEHRSDNARNAVSQPQGRLPKGRGVSDQKKANASAKKDELDDAMGDLNRSTNRLRRKFDVTDMWMETRVQVENVLEDARRVNQAMTRGSYGAEAARLWAALRSQINDLARVYRLTPLAL